MSLYTLQPITDYTIFTTPDTKKKPILFQATWNKTLKDLARELDHLHATDVILEIGVQPGELRLDGTLRSRARVAHPGVRMSFQTRDHGALSYTCDTYAGNWAHQMPDWQANVRAIVLTLESLRAVDRYGATKGEQYAGFKALPAGSGATPLGGLTKSDAVALFDELSGSDEWQKVEGGLAVAFKRARAAAHPDRHDGDRSLWDQVEQSAKVLGLA